MFVAVDLLIVRIILFLLVCYNSQKNESFSRILNGGIVFYVRKLVWLPALVLFQ